MEEDDDDINYVKCCFFNENVCGEWKILRRKGIFSLHQLNDDVHSLPGIKEKELILSRAPKCEFTDESFICAHHRHSYGIDWTAPNRCLHPFHVQLAKRNLKKKNERTANIHHVAVEGHKYGNA